MRKTKWTGAARLALLLCPLALASCGEDASAARASLPPVEGARLDAMIGLASVKPAEDAPAAAEPNVDPVGGPSDDGAQPAEPTEPTETAEATQIAGPEGPLAISFLDLLLDDETKEDLLDALIYPDEYSEEERAFPPDIAAFDGKKVTITGYMIPLLWNETKVTEFMLVGDLLQCCFGGAPEPDEWLSAVCREGYESEYYPFVPVVVTGTFKIEGIEDDAGYAAGAYHMIVDSVEKEL